MKPGLLPAVRASLVSMRVTTAMGMPIAARLWDLEARPKVLRTVRTCVFETCSMVVRTARICILETCLTSNGTMGKLDRMENWNKGGTLRDKQEIQVQAREQ